MPYREGNLMPNKILSKEEKQRIYDAMLIRAWRKDVTVERLRLWLKPYNICILDKDLIRTTSYIQQRVARFIGIQLKPLSDKLFDGKPEDDIKILNWLGNSKLKCENTTRLDINERKSAMYTVKKEKKLTEYLRNNSLEQKLTMTPRTTIKTIRNRHR